MAHVVIPLSGGFDSAVLLGIAIEERHSIHTVTFDYGQANLGFEKRAVSSLLAMAEARKATIRHRDVSIRGILGTGDMNGGKGVVPLRNAVFLSMAASLAEEVKADELWFASIGGKYRSDVVRTNRAVGATYYYIYTDDDGASTVETVKVLSIELDGTASVRFLSDDATADVDVRDLHTTRRCAEAKLATRGGNRDWRITTPDASQVFVEAFRDVLKTGGRFALGEKQLLLRTPMASFSKTAVLSEAIRLNLPIKSLRSCFSDSPEVCGKCEACVSLTTAAVELLLSSPDDFGKLRELGLPFIR